MQMSKVS